ncbi:hypothetical protein BDV59DRAFT_33351 [Aspergillus ambiguus]|uniref:OB-fold domain-containing protein n=1 Tax=Aspergillus ambiguus TaxID=176160 RepID=UPI003CCCBC9C
METVGRNELVFYPAFCFRAAPTHFAWVKMSAADVHRLKRRPGFEDQSIYFYHNHPIRFVSLVGLIVARTDVARRTILTLDDSSGATIEIAVLKAPGQPPPSLRADEALPARTPPGNRHLAATQGIDLDISALEPGALAQVKGTLSTFRGMMQVQLERVFRVRDTNAEMRFLEQRRRYFIEVLSVPWVLTPDEVARLREEAEADDERVEEEQARARKRLRRRAEREEKDYRRILRRWEREERVRQQEAELCRDAGIKTMREVERRRAAA